MGASVNYATSNLTAVAGKDYSAASGTLKWAVGDGSAKPITVALTGAAEFSGNRTFALTLSAATGGTLASPDEARVTISGEGPPMGQAAAARLLMQGTMGASFPDLRTAGGESYDAWFKAQAAAPMSLELPRVAVWNANRLPSWWYNAVYGKDQLLQRMAFALSEIFVVSQVNGILYSQDQGLANYYDQLSKNALGNFRDLLDTVSHSPTMGIYLSFFRNNKPDAATNVHADENYAREIMQLFTIGLWQLNPDGSQRLDGSGNPIATYGQVDVTNLARVFTGWASAPVGGTTGDAAWNILSPDYLSPLQCYQSHHDTDPKTIVGGVTIAGGGTCEADMKAALDALFNHPNVGPFIAKRLIQRLVTSNPSRDYIARVAAVFANDGLGARGDLLAVAQAILTDHEAITLGTSADSGKLREPLLKLTGLWRAFSATEGDGAVSDPIIFNATKDFAQNSLWSPTVFNFFNPAYQRAGPLTAAGLVVPEFQIVNENTIVLTANDMEVQSYKFVDSSGHAQIGTSRVGGEGPPGATDMVLHTKDWEPYAADSGALIDKLALVFMPGQMPTEMRTVLVNYVNAIPVTNPADRVIEAAQVMLDSPQYAVQR